MIALVAFSLALAAESPRLLIVPVQASDDETARIAHDEATKAAHALKRFRVPNKRERDDVLARAARSGLTCDARTADCATRIGVFGGFDFVLVTAVDDGTHLVARVALYDCTDGRELRMATAPLSNDDARRRSGLQKLTARALGESLPLTGALQVTGPDMATVDVDDTPRGVTPFTLVVDAGVHDVVVRSASGVERRVRVTVPLDDTALLDVTTSPDDIPSREETALRDDAVVDESGPQATDVPERSSILGLSLGVVAGAGLVGAGLVTTAGAAGAAFLVAPDENTRAAMTAREYNDAVLLGRVFLGVSALGIVLAAVGAGVFLVGGLGLE